MMLGTNVSTGILGFVWTAIGFTGEGLRCSEVTSGLLERPWHLMEGALGQSVETAWGLVERAWGLVEMVWGLVEMAWSLLEMAWGLLDVAWIQYLCLWV